VSIGGVYHSAFNLTHVLFNVSFICLSFYSLVIDKVIAYDRISW